jgi:hypothetical protein
MNFFLHGRENRFPQKIIKKDVETAPTLNGRKSSSSTNSQKPK